MKILVTGGSGYIGSRIALHLYNIGHEVVISTRRHLQSIDWIDDTNIRVVNIDWSDLRSISKAIHRSDIVIHAAGMGAKQCEDDPIEAVNFNALCTARLVSAAKKAKVKKIIYFSTIHVYSSDLSGKITESSCANNLHPYATSHKAAEDCVLAVNQSRDIQGIVLRLSNVVGAPLDKEIKCWTLLVNDICRQAVTTKKIILRSNGAQYRDFISISTVNNAISCLIKNNSSALGGIYNLGSGKSVSVLDISKTVQELFLKEYGLNIEITINQDDNYKLIDRLQYRVDKIKQIVPKFDSSIKNDLSDVLDFTVSFYNN